MSLDAAPERPVQRVLSDRLFLSLRTCATHPAGPLRAVSELVEALECGEIDIDDALDVVEDVAARYRQQVNVPTARLEVVERFLAALLRRPA